MLTLHEGRNNAFVRRVFSVMHRRDDLPEMTVPLAVLFFIGAALFAAAGAKLASPIAPVETAGWFDPQNLLGTAASFPFYPLAACFYALLILLWRRFASLLATPVMFGVMLWFGADLFSAAAVSVSMLFVSYVFAVSLISRENRFRRLTSLALAAAACLVLTVIAWIGLRFDSFSSFITAYMEEVPAHIGEIITAYMKTASGGLGASMSEIPDFYLEMMARDLLMTAPACLGVLSIVLAWFVDFLACTAFRILDCEDVFIEITRRITLPFSYAVIYAAVFVLFLLTSSEYNPMLYLMLRSVLYVMLLPCAAVGIAELMRFLEDRLYYLTREKLLAAIILVLAFAFLGIFPFLLAASAVGAAAVIRARLLSRADDGKDSSAD